MLKGILSFVVLASPAWGQCVAPYLYQRSITVNSAQVTGTHTNFPMLVLNPTNSLRTIANGGRLNSANGYDVTFVDGGGAAIPFELVGHGTSSTTYSATTGNVEFWVNVSSMLTGAVVYMCYGAASITTYQGNDQGTWNSGYSGVWHLPNGTTLAATDSTVNANNLTNTVAPSVTAGKIDGGTSFDGTTQYQSGPTLNGFSTGNMTMEAWLRPDISNDTSMVFSHDNNFTLRVFSDHFQIAFGNAPWVTGDFLVSSNYTFNNTTWFHVVGTLDGANFRIYVNGALDGTLSDSHISGGGPFTVGRYDFNTIAPFYYYFGGMDELRISNTTRSTNWITAEYNNQSAPGSFYTVSSESGTGAATFSASPIAVPTGNPADIVVSLTGTGTSWAAQTFTISGVAGVAKISQNISSGTAATLVITTGQTSGTLTISDGTIATSITVGIGSAISKPYIVIY